MSENPAHPQSTPAAMNIAHGRATPDNNPFTALIVGAASTMLQADGAPAMMRRSGVADQAADPWEAAVYEAAEIGRWVRLKPSQVRRWLRMGASGQRSTPASFLDVVDLLFVAPFLDRGLRLRQLRAALDEAGDLLGFDHFAVRDFFTDGHGIFQRTRTYGDAMLRLLSDGQWVAADDIQDVAGSIDFDDGSGLAERWFPSGIDGLIVIDPLVENGRPAIDGRAVSTADVHAAFAGAGHSVAGACARLGLDTGEVEAAVLFEERSASR